MTTERRKDVIVWTDGACLENPGRGGYAAVLLCGKARKELTGGYRLTTNNRMEMRAAIAALQALRYPCRVTIHSDSRYLVDGVMQGTMRRWRSQNWWRGGKLGLVPNADLWEELLALCDKHEVTLVWVPGHAGVGENDICDGLAVQAARSADLAADEGYERREELALAAGPPLPLFSEVSS